MRIQVTRTGPGFCGRTREFFGDNGVVIRQTVTNISCISVGFLSSVSAPTLFMASEQPIELEGTVFSVLPGTMFRVKLDNQHEVLAHMSGKMRKHFVRLTVGDRVRLEMSPYDLSKARITYRLR